LWNIREYSEYWAVLACVPLWTFATMILCSFLKVLVIGGMDTSGKASDRVYE
jgi:hypothetical protein